MLSWKLSDLLNYFDEHPAPETGEYLLENYNDNDFERNLKKISKETNQMQKMNDYFFGELLEKVESARIFSDDDIKEFAEFYDTKVIYQWFYDCKLQFNLLSMPCAAIFVKISQTKRFG